jgi:hypothetical protein
MRRHIIIAILVACIVVGVGNSGAGDKMPQDVSVVQLLATPEKFDGKLVRVFGFLRLAFESDALYLHREDDTQDLTRNAMCVDRTEGMEREQEKLNAHYVLIEATFDAEDMGHMGLFGSALEKVKRIIPWPSAAPK